MTLSYSICLLVASHPSSSGSRTKALALPLQWLGCGRCLGRRESDFIEAWANVTGARDRDNAVRIWVERGGHKVVDDGDERAATLQGGG